MDEYIKQKLDLSSAGKTQSKGIRLAPQTPISIQKPLIKQIKYDTLLRNKFIDQLDFIENHIKQLKKSCQKNSIMQNETNETGTVLELKECKKSQGQNPLSDRFSQKPEVQFQQSQKLVGTTQLAKKREHVFLKSPNQLSDEEISPLSDKQSSEQQFVP